MKVEARSIGPIAVQALKNASSATVIASFRRSFYLQAGDHVICVADEKLHEGPFNIVVQSFGRFPDLAASPVAVGQLWAIGEKALSTIEGPVIDIGLGASRVWRPKPPPINSLDPNQVRLALNTLRTLAAPRDRSEGLLQCVLQESSQPHSALERAAMKIMQNLSRHVPAWLSGGDPKITGSFGALLGLGPGLTPSGDDLIAGFLIGSSYIGRKRQAFDLWRQLEDKAVNRTTPISVAHLSAAGQGWGAAPFHALVDALVENRTAQLPKALDAVASIGHSSGLDAVGGLILLLEACVEAADNQTISAA